MFDFTAKGALLLRVCSTGILRTTTLETDVRGADRHHRSSAIRALPKADHTRRANSPLTKSAGPLTKSVGQAFQPVDSPRRVRKDRLESRLTVKPSLPTGCQTCQGKTRVPARPARCPGLLGPVPGASFSVLTMRRRRWHTHMLAAVAHLLAWNAQAAGRSQDQRSEVHWC